MNGEFNFTAPRCAALSLAIFVMLLAQAPAEDAAPRSSFVFKDVAKSAGLFPHAEQMQVHAAGWGDADGDGSLDLYIATFFEPGLKRNLLLHNRAGRFELDQQPALQIATRATGAAWCDLDNDGDLDLYVSSMPRPESELLGCRLFRNDNGKFEDISEGNGACPAAFGGRSAAAVDFDGDGLLDLLVGEDPLTGYNGSKTRSSRLFRNLGKLQFADVTAEVGIEAGIPGLGVAAADVNNDTWPDLFIASHGGGNRLWLNDGHGRFREAVKCRQTFAWPEAGGDNMVCGVTFGDVNQDGQLDIVLGPHFKRPWVAPIAPRLFLHRGLKDGEPVYENVTQAAGLDPLPLKSPHVEIQDFDNDGLLDIGVSIVKFADGRPYPIIYRNQGVTSEGPRFVVDGLGANDFPTSEDRGIEQTGKFFSKMVADSKIMYAAAAPAADYDQDGRVDLFCGSWWPERRSLLLHNETPGGHWLQVSVEGPSGVNRQAVGARVNVYPAGKLGQRQALLASREIAIGYGYASAQPAIAYLGLGKVQRVDVEVVLPHGNGKIERPDVAADQRLTLTRSNP